MTCCIAVIERLNSKQGKTNNAAVKAADDKAVAAQGEVDALEIVVANNKSATDTAIENITKENGTIDAKVAASAAATKTAYEAADETTLSSAKTYAKDYADSLAGNYDAAGSAAAAQSAAIEAAKTETTTQVNALANGAVKTNTEAISAINNAENGILAQAKSYTNAEITALNLNELSRVPAECAEASKWCVLTSNGTNYYWEVIVRGATDDAQPTGSVIPSMN